ncbi:hypothetical protein ACQ4M3_29480 [Leptolyngbya sp. AN03gr2]|uniref:hypothetical protein n=1 Tax=unclassified Leptolyngbya TaxID=2650499 RepID=UPI003D32119C
MLISRIHRFLIPSGQKIDRLSIVLWFSLSLGFALFYGALALQKAFRAEYVVQDDAREYVFWMQRFIDPSLLPNDLIAQYFRSITPPGYAAIYQLMAMFGIEPLWFSKVLPVGLGLIATLYSFAICLRLFPIPIAAFTSTLLLNQSLWFRDDLSSATPRSFVTPLFLAFLYALIRNQRSSLIVVLILQALIYPPLVFITLILLSLKLWHWESGKLRFQANLTVFIGIGLSAIALIPYALSSAEFAPLITRSQALTIPELYPGGRHPFFNPNPWKFWLIGEHSGIIPPLMPPLIWLGLLLPTLMRYRSRFPLVQRINDRISVLPKIIWVSLGLYTAAHLLLLRLFFPTRYTTHSFRIVLAIAAGIVFTLLLDAAFRSTVTKLSLVLVLGIVLLLYPQVSSSFPSTNYRVSNNAALYQFLRSQPKDTLVATLSDEANNISTFAQRSVLFSREHSLPFHLGYYNQIRQRIIDVMQAQYSSDLTLAKSAIDQYQIKFWLLENTTFTSEFLQKADWLESFQPAYTNALNNLEKTPALSKLSRCSVFNSDRFTLLDAACIKAS